MHRRWLSEFWPGTRRLASLGIARHLQKVENALGFRDSFQQSLVSLASLRRDFQRRAFFSNPPFDTGTVAPAARDWDAASAGATGGTRPRPAATEAAARTPRSLPRGKFALPDV